MTVLRREFSGASVVSVDDLMDPLVAQIHDLSDGPMGHAPGCRLADGPVPLLTRDDVALHGSLELLFWGHQDQSSLLDRLPRKVDNGGMSNQTHTPSRVALEIADALNRTYQSSAIDDRCGTVLVNAARRIATILEDAGFADREAFLDIASMGGLDCAAPGSGGGD